MSVLDLQAMKPKEGPQAAPAGSRGSKNCGNAGAPSGLSVLCSVL